MALRSKHATRHELAVSAALVLASRVPDPDVVIRVEDDEGFRGAAARL